jgi:transposase-like protein
MAQPYANNPIHGAVELLKTNGFDALAEAMTVLINSAMVAERSDYLDAAPCERSTQRLGYANGCKGKQLKIRLETLPLKMPETRDGAFYPQSLARALRSERALLLAIAEM